ncbi:MAG: glucose-1-phosphate thymidylyltransferase RfbA [Bacilli bacterium]|nr:glucose-1-phosphate thymidylyltransferase RfbA [Bacilli bacterium]
MKGIILVGGKGSRLYPLTISTHKQLLPVYDKPMIYYALSTLMEAGIRDVLVISTEEFVGRYNKLLGDGKKYGMNIEYTYETSSKGIAQAFMLGEEFIGNDDVCLILGDNIFIGDMKSELLFAVKNAEENRRSTVFGYKVPDPERFGVVEFDEKGKALSIEEKPLDPKSNYAVTGLYFYTNDVVKHAYTLKPSARGELEITDINKIYLANDLLDVVTLQDEVAWLDAGTKDSLIESTIAVRDLEKAHDRKYGSPDIEAYKNKWISKDQLLARASELHPSDYAKDLLKFAKAANTKNAKR